MSVVSLVLFDVHVMINVSLQSINTYIVSCSMSVFYQLIDNVLTPQSFFHVLLHISLQSINL